MPERPSAKMRIVVPRAREQASSLSSFLEEIGVEPVELPTISFGEPEDWTPVDKALAALSSFAWVVFTSGTTVERFLEQAERHRGWKPEMARCRIAAVGPSTARALHAKGLRVDLVPSVYTSQGLLRELAPRAAGARVLLARGDIADSALPRGLEAAGAEVVEVVVYRTIPPPGLREETLRVLAQGVDIVCFTSASTVKNLVTALGSDVCRLQTIPAAVIGPVTAQAARQAGLSIVAEAEESTIPGLVAAVRQWKAQREGRDGH